MFLIHNERTKLTAAWLNTIATALLAAGALAAWLYGISTVPVSASYLAALAPTCMMAAGGLHLWGLAILGRLRQ